jgi:hypothetical protein
MAKAHVVHDKKVDRGQLNLGRRCVRRLAEASPLVSATRKWAIRGASGPAVPRPMATYLVGLS